MGNGVRGQRWDKSGAPLPLTNFSGNSDLAGIGLGDWEIRKAGEKEAIRGRGFSLVH